MRKYFAGKAEQHNTIKSKDVWKKKPKTKKNYSSMDSQLARGLNEVSFDTNNSNELDSSNHNFSFKRIQNGWARRWNAVTGGSNVNKSDIENSDYEII